jgi:paraquat-inducible protein B
MSGIAGGRFLQMYYPENADIVKLYPQLTFKPKYPVIKSAPSGIQEIETAMRDILDKLRQIKFYEISSQTIKFLEMTSKFFSNQELYDIVAKIDSSATTVKNILKNADTSDIIDNFQLTSQKLLQVSVELDFFTNNLNNQIEKLQLANKVDSVFAQIDSALLQTKKVVDVLGFRSETLLFGLNEAVEEAKSTSRQFRQTLKTWSDNPSNVFFSNPPPPEK